ncbi:MAG: ABC transporter ATP-binding protein [Deltaproteobacteria bacterium]|nr:ABC transporter ATP-binding protein [Deltaproteobacteria bacterium]
MNAAATPLLELRDVSTSFRVGGFFTPRLLKATQEVSFTLDRGEIVGVVGESGSGKSTIARLISRLVPTTGGAMLLDGDDVLVSEPRRASLAYRRRVQMIFQDPFGSLNPVHTVAHHIERPLLLHGKATKENARSAALELLDDVGLRPAEDFIDQHPHSLSGGQRQRVAIARALAPEPDIILADEPTSMLDVSIRMDVLRLLDDLRHKRGLAILFITHDLAAAKHLADRIVVMYAGRMMEEAPADQLVKEPAHPYSQLLMAAVPRRGGSLHDPLPADPGTPPLVDPRPGCPFAARCRQTVAACTTTTPPVIQLGPGHRVACHLHTARTQ